MSNYKDFYLTFSFIFPVSFDWCSAKNQWFTSVIIFIIYLPNLKNIVIVCVWNKTIPWAVFLNLLTARQSIRHPSSITRNICDSAVPNAHIAESFMGIESFILPRTESTRHLYIRDGGDCPNRPTTVIIIM